MGVLRLYRQAYRGLPRPVWRLSVVAFINRSGTMVLPFLTLWLTGQQGFTTGQAGSFLTLYGLGGLAGTYFGGWACDRVAPRRIQIGSLAATGALFFVLGLSRGAVPIALSVLALAVVGESFRPANATSLSRWSEPEVRSRAFALRRLAVNLGMTFGPAAGGFLAGYGYGWLFVVDGATCLLAAATLAWLLPDEPGFGPVGEPESSDLSSPREGRSAATREGASSPWRDHTFLLYLGLLGLITMVIFQFAGTWPLTLRDLYGFPENRIGLLLAINTLLIVAVEMVLIHAVQRRDPLRVMAVGALFVGGGFALLPFGSTFAFAGLTVVIWTVGEMLLFPLSESVAAGRAGRLNPGRYLGVFATSFGLSFSLANGIGPWIYQAFGPTALWLGAGVLGILVAAGLRALAPRMAAPLER